MMRGGGSYLFAKSAEAVSGSDLRGGLAAGRCCQARRSGQLALTHCLPASCLTPDHPQA